MSPAVTTDSRDPTLCHVSRIIAKPRVSQHGAVCEMRPWGEHVHRATTLFYLERSNSICPPRWVLASLGRYLDPFRSCLLGTTTRRSYRAWIPSGALGSRLLPPCWLAGACRRRPGGHPQRSTWMVLGSRLKWGMKPCPNTQDHPVWAPLAGSHHGRWPSRSGPERRQCGENRCESSSHR